MWVNERDSPGDDGLNAMELEPYDDVSSPDPNDLPTSQATVATSDVRRVRVASSIIGVLFAAVLAMSCRSDSVEPASYRLREPGDRITVHDGYEEYEYSVRERGGEIEFVYDPTAQTLRVAVYVDDDRKHTMVFLAPRWWRIDEGRE